MSSIASLKYHSHCLFKARGEVANQPAINKNIIKTDGVDADTGAIIGTAIPV